jgi:hypothetical protein
MISSSNFIKLPYSPDLTEGGIAHALRSLSHGFDGPASSLPYERMRRSVANTAVEIAFRRYLSRQDIPFEVQTAMPFTDSERYDVSLDGRRCDLKSYWISHREQISEMRHKPQILLDAPALVPSDQHAREGHKRDDLYIFAFLAGLTAASQDDLKKVLVSDQPHYLAYAMPQEWRKPSHWNPLGTLALKSESAEELLVEIQGQDSGRELMRKTISLPPKTRVLIHEGFYAISALHVRRMPDARVGIHCEGIRETCIISPTEWGNLWVYGMDIFLTGWVSYEEFSQLAKPLPVNSRTFQYEHTKVKNLTLPISELKPLSHLFDKSHP